MVKSDAINQWPRRQARALPFRRLLGGLTGDRNRLNVAD